MKPLCLTVIIIYVVCVICQQTLLFYEVCELEVSVCDVKKMTTGQLAMKQLDIRRGTSA